MGSLSGTTAWCLTAESAAEDMVALLGGCLSQLRSGIAQMLGCE